MTFAERERLINRIVVGKLIFDYKGSTYTLKSPTLDIKYRADTIYHKIMDKYKYSGWLTKDMSLRYLISKGLWIPQNDQKIKDMEKEVEKLKMAMFESYLQKTKVEQIRAQLNKVRQRISDLYRMKSTLDDATIEGYANTCKVQYIIGATLFYKGRRVYKNRKIKPSGLIQAALRVMVDNTLSVTDIREVARTQPWRSSWIKTMQIFTGTVSEWSDEQRALASFSSMYDGAYENPDCPPQAVIDDDDMFDGWLIQERKKMERQRKQDTIDQLGSKHSQAAEVGIPVRSQAEAREIYKLNSPSSQIIKKQRANMVKQQGKVKHGELPDIRAQKRLQAMNMRRDAIKGRK